MGVGEEYGFGTLRLSWGRHSTEVSTLMHAEHTDACSTLQRSAMYHNLIYVLLSSAALFLSPYLASLPFPLMCSLSQLILISVSVLSLYSLPFSLSLSVFLSLHLSFSLSLTLLLLLLSLYQGEIDRAADSIAAAVSTLTESRT